MSATGCRSPAEVPRASCTGSLCTLVDRRTTGEQQRLCAASTTESTDLPVVVGLAFGMTTLPAL